MEEKTENIKTAERHILSGRTAGYVPCRIHHLDLFSGIAGFALAAKSIFGKKYVNVGHSEIDEDACKIYHKHFKDSECLGDIRKISLSRLGSLAKMPPLLEGLAGKRTGLFHELAKVIELSKPQWFILENVPGLLSTNRGQDMAFIIKTLSGFGYCVGWRVLDAQYFGVAQRRKRLFIVGSFGDFSSIEILFKQAGGNGNDKTFPKMEQRQVALCLNTRSGEHYNPTNETVIAQTLTATIRGVAGRLWEETYITEINAEGKGEIDGLSRGLDD